MDATRLTKLANKLANMDLKVLVKLEGDWLVAVCLDPFIAVQARSMTGLIWALASSFVGNAMLALKHGMDPFSNLGPAPASYHEAFAKATALKSHKLPLGPARDAFSETTEWRESITPLREIPDPDFMLAMV